MSAEKKTCPDGSEKTAEKQNKKEKKQKQAHLLFPANKKGMHISHRMNFLRFMAYPIHSLIYPFKLHGYKKVGPGAYIYVGNHYCLWDIFYPAHTTREVVHFLAKESVLHAPVLGHWAREVGVIGAMRDGTDVRTLMDSMKVLKNGEKLSMFPEGTRNKVSDEEFLPFHGGAALMAIKTRTPIIPFVICNRPRVFHRTHVVFGEPMEFSEYYGRKLTQADYDTAEEKLKACLYRMREQFRLEQAEKKRKKK